MKSLKNCQNMCSYHAKTWASIVKSLKIAKIWAGTIKSSKKGPKNWQVGNH